MKGLPAFLIVPLAFVLAGDAPAQGKEVPPAWAYPVNPPDLKPAPDDGTLRRVPGSTAAFTLTQVRDRHFSPVWHPEEHPPQPEVVARGRKPDLAACGFCHRADGPGGPENANLAGLPAAYIVQQSADFKTGARKSSVPKRNIDQKLAMFQAATDAEVAAAAAYFSALKPRTIIKVVETDTVPKTFIIANHLAAVKTGETEPIGQRIIEVPEDLERFISRDTHAVFIAYVPVGSIEKGRALAASGGGGKTVPCGICHGSDLKGLGPIPGIAGRSTNYTVRQLYDFKHGSRAGPGSALMKPSVEKLTVDDMLVLAAYLASLAP
jgi:cytochrome c553